MNKKDILELLEEMLPEDIDATVIASETQEDEHNPLSKLDEHGIELIKIFLRNGIMDVVVKTLTVLNILGEYSNGDENILETVNNVLNVIAEVGNKEYTIALVKRK